MDRCAMRCRSWTRRSLRRRPMRRVGRCWRPTQIRELMGSVPNAVFERLLEAVAAGQSAELMEQLNVLLNAGHSPSSLARQMVRYLRNALMAKLGGEQTELLQISADERARAARTALLFTEEDLTRNLQIVLRTFDDLNYRQEQRFHLELGLLKLMHAQRLLPLEELLSGLAGGTGCTQCGSPRGTADQRARGSTIDCFGFCGVAGTDSVSFRTEQRPHESNGGEAKRSSIRGDSRERHGIRSAGRGSARSDAVPGGVECGGTGHRIRRDDDGRRAGEGSPERSEIKRWGWADGECSARCGLFGSGDGRACFSFPALRRGVRGASMAASLRIEVAGMGKKMLSLTVNAASEKIIRQELQRLGASARLLIVPGAGNAVAPAMMSTPAAGSVEEEALQNPLVQRAKEIFQCRSAQCGRSARQIVVGKEAP